MAVQKRKRKPKVSKGIHGGGGKTRLSYAQKILMGKGRLVSLRTVDCKPWRGALRPGDPVFDAKQAELNKQLYPDLF